MDQIEKAAQRLQEHECRMKARGFAVQPAVGPGFCSPRPFPRSGPAAGTTKPYFWICILLAALICFSCKRLLVRTLAYICSMN